jgi:hypothetical protein
MHTEMVLKQNLFIIFHKQTLNDGDMSVYAFTETTERISETETETETGEEKFDQ